MITEVKLNVSGKSPSQPDAARVYGKPIKPSKPNNGKKRMRRIGGLNKKSKLPESKRPNPQTRLASECPFKALWIAKAEKATIQYKRPSKLVLRVSHISEE